MEKNYCYDLYSKTYLKAKWLVATGIVDNEQLNQERSSQDNK